MQDGQPGQCGLRDVAGDALTRLARWPGPAGPLSSSRSVLRAPAGQALSTPLMAGLARAIYNPVQVSRSG
jgi:hypothetical protein